MIRPASARIDQAYWYGELPYWDEAMSGQAETSRPILMPDVDSPSDGQANPTELSAQMVQTARVVIVALIISAVATGFLTQDTSERFPGYLQTQKKTVVAPFDCVVEFVDVQTGQVVLPGKEIFGILNIERDRLIATAEDELTRLNSLLATAKANAHLAFEQRLVEIAHDSFQTKLQLAEFMEAEFQHKFEANAIEEYVDLFDALAVSTTSTFDLKRVVLKPKQSNRHDEMFSIIQRATLTNQLETLQAKISLCENHLRDLRDCKDTIKTQVATIFQVAELESKIKIAETKLRDAQEQEYSHSVIADVYGMAGMTQLKIDDKVKAGETLVELYDRDTEFIQVRLPSRVVHSLKPGSIVHVHFPGDVLREGKIESIPPEVTIDGTDAQPESQLELQVQSSGKPWPAIPIGSTVYVSLPEETGNDTE
jgi:multidrug resistance efflux pump